MKPQIVLEGGAEFGGQMAVPDRKALELAGGFEAPVVIVPTAAAPDQNHTRAGSNGRRWFQSLGARRVAVSGLIDRESAGRGPVVSELHSARLIYLLGGFPAYLAETLRDTPAWQAILQAGEAGAVIAGSSAGAMVLCEHLYDPAREQVVPGLGLLPETCFLPHHNTFGQRWVGRLSALLPGRTLLGVDEQTGLVYDGERWQVLGAGRAVIYRAGFVKIYPAGEFLPVGSLAVLD